MKRGFLWKSVKPPKLKHNDFPLSHFVKTSCDFGTLVPVLCQEVVPGDVWKQRTSFYMRFQPLISPIMHEVNVYFHTFFVPVRLLWSEFFDFLSWTSNDTSSRPVVPYFTPSLLASLVGNDDVLSLCGRNSLWDYFGLRAMQGGSTGTYFSNERIISLPFRAYQMIWNEFYRDENLQDEFEVPLTSGNESVNIYQGSSSTYLRQLLSLRRRCWEKDMFTSALPFLQSGDPVELLPDQTYSATTTITANYDGNSSEYGPLRVNPINGDVNNKPVYITKPNSGVNAFLVQSEEQQADDTINFNKQDIANMLKAETDVTSLGSGITINSLRRASKLQEWKELFARGGKRRIEILLSHFGVASKDSRLQRPEYIGGSCSPVVIQEVLQTSASQDEAAGVLLSPQANPAGKASSAGSTRRMKYKVDEFGYIITLLSVVPRSSYYGGLERKWTRFDNLDWYWPKFANLGEQEVKNKEVFFNPNANYTTQGDRPDDVFGYAPRYSEYKYINDMFTGDFADTLQFWHMGRIFNSPQHLNSDFVTCNPDDRIFAVQDDNYKNSKPLLFEIFHNINGWRPMPKFGTPRLT